MVEKLDEQSRTSIEQPRKRFFDANGMFVFQHDCVFGIRRDPGYDLVPLYWV